MGLLAGDAAAQNPVVIENQQPGTAAWNIPSVRFGTDAVGQIKGYASDASVNKGENITFYVSVRPAQTYTIDIYRIGWYQGLGGRLVQSIGPLDGVQQPACPMDATTGSIECHWTAASTLTTQTSWTSGLYLAVLTNAQAFQNYIGFVVRDDNRIAHLLYQQPVTTHQAYNNYPNDGTTGKSLYDFNSFGATTVGGTKAAVKVSYDRPFSNTGIGEEIRGWEISFIRWIEKSGYDVAYSTNIDTHTDGHRLFNYRGFLSVGHDEYWSTPMYDAAIAARDAGVNLGFFSANSIYWQVRFEASSTGVPNRVMVCYRLAAIDPVANPALKTVNWRDPPVNRPEQTLIGVQYSSNPMWSNPGFATYVVTNRSHWVYAGTGFQNGDTVPGIVGYEADRLFSEYPGPDAVNGTYTLLSHSPFFNGPSSPDYSNSSVYQAHSGAWVFASGTIDWSWALDSYSGGSTWVDPRIQRATANILDRFIAAGPGGFSVGASPSTRTVAAGASTDYSITITPAGSFADPVTLSVSGLPGGATGSFSPNPTSGSSTLVVTTSATTPDGSYPLSIVGVSGSLTNTATVSLIVTHPHFTLSAAPSSQTVPHGGATTTYNVAIGRLAGFQDQVAFSVSGLPTGTTASFDPNPSATASTLTVTTSLDSPAGTYSLTISGVSGSLTATVSITLEISAPTFLFTEGFEGTGFEHPGWLNGGANENYTTTPLHGLQSLNASGSQYIHRPFQHGPSVSLYFRVRWNSWTSSFNNLMYWHDSAGNTAGGLFSLDRSLEIVHGSVFAAGTTTLALNTTYHVWVEWNQGTGSNGTMTLFLSTDGVKPSAPEATLTTGTGGATQGMFFGPTQAGQNVILDRLLVDDVPIGSNPGEGANQSPTISDLADRTTDEDVSTGAVAFTIGDAETAAGSLTVSATSSNATLVPAGHVVLGGTGANRTVTVTPAAQQSGTTTITLTVSDGALTATESFVLTVTAVNDPPTISNLPDGTVVQHTSTGPLGFTMADLETAADGLTVSGASSNGTLVPVSNMVFGGAGTNRTLTVTPAAGQTGTATLTVTVSDGTLTASDTFVLTVTPSITAPTISDLADQTTDEDVSTGAVAFTVGDAETAAGSLTVSATSSNATLVPAGNVVLGGTGANRTVTVTPAAHQSGTATITLTVSDGALTATESFVLTVTAVNDPPTISNLPDGTVVQDTSTGPLGFTMADLETAADGLTVSGASSNGTLVPVSNLVFAGSGTNRTLTVTPAAGQTGTATLTVTVSDGTLTASDTFVLTVTPSITAPTISDLADRTTDEDVSTGAVAFTVGDAETAAGSLTVSATSSNATLVPAGNVVLGGTGANRTVTVTPAAQQSGTTTITLTVSDGALTATESFGLTVTAVNDPPTISNLPDGTVVQHTSTGPLGFTMADLETAADGLTVSGASSNGTLVPVSNMVFAGSGTNRTLTVTPAAGQTGTATLTVTVSDGILTASDTFVLTVTPSITAPTISDLADRTTDEDVSTGAVAFTVGDAETAAASLTVSATSSNATLVPAGNVVLGGTGANRTVTVTPAAQQSGTTTITLTVSDGALTATESFVLTVTAVNDPPLMSNLPDQTIGQDTSTGPLGFTMADLETAADGLTVSGASSNGTLVPISNLVFAGSGTNRTLTVTPAAGQTGTATLTVTVSDGTLTTSTTFVLTVNPTTPPATYLFTEGFEGTGFENPGWLNGGANENYTTTPLHGLQSLNASGSQYIYRPFQHGPSVSLYFRVRWNSWTSSFNNLMYWHDSLGNTAGGLFSLDRSLEIVHGSVFAFGTTTLALNTTYHVWVEWSQGTGSNGTMTLFLSTDGVKPSVPEATLTTGTGGATQDMFFGPTQAGQDVILDRLLVDDVPIGSNPGEGANQPPTISDLADRATNEDVSTGAVAFTVGDAETAAGSLTVSATSSNATLVPAGNVVLGGTGANRTVTVTPAAHQSGTATITLTVSDGALTATESFGLTVTAVNDPPLMSNLPDQTIGQDTSTGPLGFTMADLETAAGSLIVSGASSNGTLVPISNLVFGGSGTNRTLTVTPAAGQTGTATLTVMVSDGTLTASTTFMLTVNPTTPPATYLFTEGFEGTGFENPGWLNGGANENYTTTPLHGLQSLNASGSQYIYRPFQHGPSVSLYFRVRWNSWTSSFNNLMYWHDSAGNTAGGLFSLDRSLEVVHGSVFAVGTTTLALNTTYHVWVEWSQGTGSNGTMTLFLSTDGVKPSAPEATLTTGTGGATQGMFFGPTQAGQNVILDRLLVDDVPIGSNPN